MFTDYIQDKYIKLINIYIKHNHLTILRNTYIYSKIKDKLDYYFHSIDHDDKITEIEDIKINVRDIKFSYFQELYVKLPKSIKVLSLQFQSFHKTIHFLKDTPYIKELKLSDSFTEPNPIFPKTLTKLHLGADYRNISVDFIFDLPKLEDFDFGTYLYKFPITRLPKQLKILNLRHNKIDIPTNCLEELQYLEQLTIGNSLNLKTKLPLSLKRLYIPRFNKNITETEYKNFLINLPPFIEYLHLGYYFNESVTDIISIKLLKGLHLGDYFNSSVDCLEQFQFLEELILDNPNFNCKIFKLPKSLKRLKTNGIRKSLIKCSLRDIQFENTYYRFSGLY